MPMSRRLGFSLIAASLATTGARAQGLRAKASPDPYTKNDPALLQQLGYENLGPFEFGSNQSCASIENLLGTEPLMWVETKHFRLGCSLPGIPVKGLEDWRRGDIEPVAHSCGHAGRCRQAGVRRWSALGARAPGTVLPRPSQGTLSTTFPA